MADDLVNVAVPKKHLQRVYRLLADLDEDGGGSGDGTLPPRGGDGDGGTFEEWTNARLERMVSESGQAMRDILRALVLRPGDWLSTADLAKAIEDNPDADWNTIAGMLGAFGRRIRNRYGLDTWPMEWRRFPDGAGMHYMMPSHMAKRIHPLLDD